MSTLTQLPGTGLIWPPHLALPNVNHSANGFTPSTAATLDATGEKTSFIGYIFWQGRAASKTVSSSGGKIYFRTGSVTFADAGTTLRVGLQDVATAAGPVIQPDDTFDVFDDITGGDAELTSSSDNVFVTATMSSGTKTLSTGALVAIVFDMTAKGGADSVVLQEFAGIAGSMLPTVSTNLTGTWSVATPGRGIAVIEADDGTLGIIAGTLPLGSLTARSFSDATNPDEEGMIFRVPVDCKIGGYMLMLQSNNADADYEINIYSDPTGTPAVVSGTTITGLGEQGSGATRTPAIFMLASEVSLTAGTDYCLSIKATGSSQIVTTYNALRSADDRPLMGLTNCGRTTRNGGTGAFAAATTNEIPHFGLFISSIHAPTGNAQLLIGMN